MTESSPSWTIRHFSQANPAGAGQYDVPALLRRVADTLEDMGPVDVQDVVFHLDTDADGDEHPSMTVYFHPTVTFDDVRNLFKPFFRGATKTADMDLTVEGAGADEGGVYVLVKATEGTWDGFRFDRQGRGDDSAAFALECFDVLHKTVHEALARRGTARAVAALPDSGAHAQAHHLLAGGVLPGLVGLPGRWARRPDRRTARTVSASGGWSWSCG